jgi:hypothetical protein
METLGERYTRYLKAKEGDIDLCEYLTFTEYNILYEAGYRDLEKKKSKALKYGAAAAALPVATVLAIPTIGVGSLAGVAAIAALALKLYRNLTDKCNKECHAAGYKKAEFGLCKAKCKVDAASRAIKELESKRNYVLSKIKKNMMGVKEFEKAKQDINRRFDKKIKFFKDKIHEDERMINSYQIKLKREKQKK